VEQPDGTRLWAWSLGGAGLLHGLGAIVLVGIAAMVGRARLLTGLWVVSGVCAVAGRASRSRGSLRLARCAAAQGAVLDREPRPAR